MATLQEYFDADFDYTVKVHIKLAVDESLTFEGAICYDFSGLKCFIAFYVPGERNTLDLFLRLLRGLEYAKTGVSLNGRITLPASRYAHGQIQVENKDPFQVSLQFFDDTVWLSSRDIESSRRVFIYSETQLAESEVFELKLTGKDLGHEVLFWSKKHAAESGLHPVPQTPS